MCEINNMNRENALALNRCIPLRYTFRSSRRRSCYQRISCLLFGVVRIFEGMVLRTYARCANLVPCCDQDGYWAQVPQFLRRNITHISITKRFKRLCNSNYYIYYVLPYYIISFRFSWSMYTKIMITNLKWN